MPAESPSDDPLLPQLRRFRFGPRDAVPREVNTPQRSAPAVASDDGPATPRTAEPPHDRQHTAEPPHGRQHPGEPAGFGVPSLRDPATLPTDVDQRDRVAASGPPTVRRGPTPPAQPAILPPTAGQSPGPPRRPRLPMILTGAAAVVVLALIGWLVLRQAGGDTEAAGGSRAAPAVPARQWADGACQALASFESSAMPVRAVAVKAAAETGTPSTDLGSLRREAEALLENLAARVTALGSPAPTSPAAALEAGLSDAVEGAIAQADKPNGSVGGPAAAASLVSQALAAPLAAFKESLEGIDEPARQEVTAIESCAALL